MYKMFHPFLPLTSWHENDKQKREDLHQLTALHSGKCEAVKCEQRGPWKFYSLFSWQNKTKNRISRKFKLREIANVCYVRSEIRKRVDGKCARRIIHNRALMILTIMEGIISGQGIIDEGISHHAGKRTTSMRNYRSRFRSLLRRESIHY